MYKPFSKMTMTGSWASLCGSDEGVQWGSNSLDINGLAKKIVLYLKAEEYKNVRISGLPGRDYVIN